MKLKLFEKVDKALDILEEKNDILHSISYEIDVFFNNIFNQRDYFLNTNCRVKSKKSLKEKILRNNLFMKYKSPENVLLNLSDLIGLRIECRFIEDEEKIYNEILSLFSIKIDEDYYTNPLNPKIILKLSDKQPEIQKNGFEIYKIDGKYRERDLYINFELQIKSMVNVFWSEIDHRILYKNFNYVLTEDFYRDIMSSIKDNLSMIDRQLMVVFNHLNDLDNRNKNDDIKQLKAMISKMIHDIYIGKVKENLGFVIGFKKSTDIIVDYIFMKERVCNPGESKEFINVLDKVLRITGNNIAFDEYISFERDLFYECNFTEKLGEIFLDIMNKDFKWNLFFKIIFEIENNGKAQEFESFLKYVKGLYLNNLKACLKNKKLKKIEKNKIYNIILASIIDNFITKPEIEFFVSEQIKELNKYIEILLYDIENYEDWKLNQDFIVSKIRSYEY